MNLISCENCGVVLNKEYLDTPSDSYSKESGEFIKDNVMWFNGAYYLKTSCPVCQGDIPMEKG